MGQKEFMFGSSYVRDVGEHVYTFVFGRFTCVSTCVYVDEFVHWSGSACVCGCIFDSHMAICVCVLGWICASVCAWVDVRERMCVNGIALVGVNCIHICVWGDPRLCGLTYAFRFTWYMHGYIGIPMCGAICFMVDKHAGVHVWVDTWGCVGGARVWFLVHVSVNLPSAKDTTNPPTYGFVKHYFKHMGYSDVNEAFIHKSWILKKKKKIAIKPIS